jgi:hypothetical protein
LGLGPNDPNGRGDRVILNEQYILELKQYLGSGDLEEDFEHSAEDRRLEMLDFLEKLMELGEAADETATRIIFKKTQLGTMAGLKDQK